MQIQKYSGAGNKFIIINNVDQKIEDYKNVIDNLISQGANSNIDGVIFVEKSEKADFKMNYFNKDGSGNTLCGNGLRATVRYLIDNNFLDKKGILIEAVSEIYEAQILDDNQISISFPSPNKIKTNFKLKVHFVEWWQLLNCSYVNCGSPHIVIFIDEIEKPKIENLSEVQINDWGKNIRMHKDLMPEGANVNFVKIDPNKNEIAIRTYERGVEGETLACGTGAVSSAIISYLTKNVNKPVKVLTESGEYLTVDFEIINNEIKKLKLIGNAIRIK